MCPVLLIKCGTGTIARIAVVRIAVVAAIFRSGVTGKGKAVASASNNSIGGEAGLKGPVIYISG